MCVYMCVCERERERERDFDSAVVAVVVNGVLFETACWYTAGLAIEWLRVRITAGELSSPESTLCADSYSVSVPHP